jgi:hypothetical protein
MRRERTSQKLWPRETRVAELRERMRSGQHKSALMIRRPQHGASHDECLLGAGLPRSSENGRAALRARAAICPTRPRRHGLRRGEGEFGLGKDIERGVGLRRGLATLPKEPRQKGLGHFGNPLLEQNADFFAQIGGMIQARKLEAFKRGVRCFAQIIPRWNDTVASHGWNPPGNKAPSATTINISRNSVQANYNIFTVGLWKSLQGSL